MNTLIITGDRNTGSAKDFTGAFDLEARALARMQEVPPGAIVRVNLAGSKPARRKQVIEALAVRRYDFVAIFCHGYRTGLQIGFGLPHVRELAAALTARKYVPNETPLHVALYACSTGGGGGAGGDGGFADRLRDALCELGAVHCRVDAHDRAGHCTRLPYVRRFEGQGSPVGGTGGQWIVAPGSKLWPKWRKALATTDLRLRFPLLDVAQIHQAL